MEHSRQLGEEKISKLMLKFSVPAIVGMMINALYNVIDRIFVGNGVGSLAIAGITIGFPIMLVLMAFGMLIGMGATALISIKLGEHNREEAELILGNGTALLVLIGAVLTVAGLLFLDPLLKTFGASEAVIPYARDYLSIILWGTVISSVGFGMSNFIRAEGNPKMAMYAMLIGAISNILLDPLFIFVFDWGIKGAAWATVLARFFTAGLILWYYKTGRSALRLHWANLRLKSAIVLKIVAIGSAPFAMQLASSVLNAILNNSLTTYGGDLAVAAMGIVMSVMMLLVMPVIGINQGAQPIIGYNYGAQNYDRVKQALKLASGVATVIVVIGFVISRVFPTQLVALFNPGDEKLIALGARAMRLFFLAMPIVGFQIVGANYFQAVGKPRHAMFLTLSRQVILLIPLILILPKFFGLNGIFYSGPLADLGSAILTGVWLLRELRQLTERQEELAVEPNQA